MMKQLAYLFTGVGVVGLGYYGIRFVVRSRVGRLILLATLAAAALAACYLVGEAVLGGI